MPRERPTLLLVFGILNLVGGIVGFLYWILAVIMMAVGPMLTPPPAPGQQDLTTRLEKVLDERVPYNKAITYASLAFDFLLCAAMVASGAGLLSVKPWARHLAMAYAVASLLLKALTFVYAIAVTIPVLTEFADTLPRTNPAETGAAIGMKIGGYAAAGVPPVMGIYPLALLIAMIYSAAAFRPERPGAADESRLDEPGDARDNR